MKNLHRLSVFTIDTYDSKLKNRFWIVNFHILTVQNFETVQILHAFFKSMFPTIFDSGLIRALFTEPQKSKCQQLIKVMCLWQSKIFHHYKRLTVYACFLLQLNPWINQSINQSINQLLWFSIKHWTEMGLYSIGLYIKLNGWHPSTKIHKNCLIWKKCRFIPKLPN